MSVWNKAVMPMVRHPLARRAPLRTAARILGWQVSSRLRPGVQNRAWIEDARLLTERGMTGATGNVYYGLHEFADMGFMMHLLRPDDLFIDIGANIGSYTVLAAKVVGADVIAIEPHPRTADRLAANVAGNAIEAKVSILRVALSDHEGSGALTAGADTMNRLVAASADTLSVALSTLDIVTRGKTPIALKIDVEGHEPAVFSGAAATLAQPTLHAVAVETVDPDILGQLASAGFVEGFYDPFSRVLSNTRGSLTASNRLFIRDWDLVAARLSSARQFDVFGVMV